MVTDAQKRATKKWEQKYEVVRFRVVKGKKKQIEEYAKSKGISINKLLNNYIDKILKNNNN